jgi:hypothetical protein
MIRWFWLTTDVWYQQNAWHAPSEVLAALKRDEKQGIIASKS